MSDLAQFSTERLLRMFARLTHQMHGTLPSQHTHYREMRDVIEAEIIRRTEENAA